MATIRPYLVYTYNQTPDSDSAEYNDEATMVKTNLENMRQAIECIDKAIKDKDNVAEWVQEKIAVNAAMLNSVCTYMKSKEIIKTV
jgi:3-hydroxyacyl-CoA dehydrogenase